MPKTNWLNRLDPATYKRDNLSGWMQNSEHWLTSPLRHVVDNDEFIDVLLKRLLRPNQTIVDMGCGNGFLYRRIRRIEPTINYIGLDFNPVFIEELQALSKGDDNAEFKQCDFEKGVPAHLREVADIVFSFFVLLEIENLITAYSTADYMLKSEGIFSLLSIEYMFLILAVSRNMRDFKRNLAKYESIRIKGGIPFTFQNIDLGDGESEDLKYGSVFHSTADYITHALDRGWSLKMLKENIQTKKFHPKVYQYLEFEK